MESGNITFWIQERPSSKFAEAGCRYCTFRGEDGEEEEDHNKEEVR